MEQAHHLLDLIHSYFPHESADIRTISPLKLAYLGDAVYEINYPHINYGTNRWSCEKSAQKNE